MYFGAAGAGRKTKNILKIGMKIVIGVGLDYDIFFLSRTVEHVDVLQIISWWIT